jgi:hypothetical protein
LDLPLRLTPNLWIAASTTFDTSTFAHTGAMILTSLVHHR